MWPSACHLVTWRRLTLPFSWWRGTIRFFTRSGPWSQAALIRISVFDFISTECGKFLVWTLPHLTSWWAVSVRLVCLLCRLPNSHGGQIRSAHTCQTHISISERVKVVFGMLCAHLSSCGIKGKTPHHPSCCEFRIASCSLLENSCLEDVSQTVPLLFTIGDLAPTWMFWADQCLVKCLITNW